MAFYNETQTRHAGVLERATLALSNWFAAGAGALERNRQARITYKQLSELSDRDLADLGVSRSEIRRIALEAASGKR